MAMALVSFGLCANAQEAARADPPARSSAYTGDYVNTFGVGFQLGAPFGVTAKYWVTDTTALDGAFGYSPYDHSTVEIHVDFLWHDFDILTPSSGRFPVYFGVGLVGRLRNEGRGNLAGFRFPVGISYMFENYPFDVFAEVSPELIMAPFVRGGIDGAVGLRYWF